MLTNRTLGVGQNGSLGEFDPCQGEMILYASMTQSVPIHKVISVLRREIKRWETPIGRTETVGAGYQYYESYVDEIRKVTPEDISRVARTYLTNENRTVGILVPQPPKAASQ